MREFNQDRTSYFLDQSVQDCPSRVRFAEESSLMSISKWGGQARLAFAPGEGHTGEMEVHDNELLLKPESTPKAYHVFRKLDEERFEYDVLLLKEPETNSIEIELDFPDGLEFFRQPSLESLMASPFRCSPEAIDSYAVYWKERNGPYKTGKFCHIYRPLIRDARGRKVWGLLDIADHRMTITIPEEWLADAAYPVVVDPVVGTQTRGALHIIDWDNTGDPVEFYFEMRMALGRFTTSNPIAGTCTSYLYSYYNAATRGQAVVYSDNGGLPYMRLSRNEQIGNFQRATPAWVASTFTLPNPISSGSSFWYGYYTDDWFFTYYDTVGTFRRMVTEEYLDIPEYFNDPWNDVYTVLMSAYFEYTVVQNLTRSMLDTVGLTETFGKQFAFKRKCVNGTTITENIFQKKTLPRVCADSFTISDTVTRIGHLFRLLSDSFLCTRNSSRTVICNRSLSDWFGISDMLERTRIVIRTCISLLDCSERINLQFELLRLLQDTSEAAERFSMIQTLFRFCTSSFTALENILRSVGFIRVIASGIEFLEHLLQRMLLKKEELIIVSRITKEIEFKGYLV